MADSSRAGETAGWGPATGPLFDAWMRASRAWMEATGRCGARMIAFVGERLEADLEHGKRLAECRDLAALGAAQGEWLRRAVEDYRRAIEQLSAEMAAGLEALREETRTAAAAAAAPAETAETRARERRAA